MRAEIENVARCVVMIVLSIVLVAGLVPLVPGYAPVAQAAEEEEAISSQVEGPNCLRLALMLMRNRPLSFTIPTLRMPIAISSCSLFASRAIRQGMGILGLTLCLRVARSRTGRASTPR